MTQRQSYTEHCEQYDHDWRALDNVLYALCRRHPRHRTSAAVNAKVGIIARAYMTGIERAIRSRGTQGSSLTQLTAFMLKNGGKIDRLLASINGYTEPLTPDKLVRIVSVHGRLVNMLRPLLRGRRSPRSFVSKYLHFHCPIVPIYDSVVATKLPRFVPWNGSLVIFRIPPGTDERYAWYAMRFYALYRQLRKVSARATVKRVDYHLLSQDGRRRHGRKRDPSQPTL